MLAGVAWAQACGRRGIARGAFALAYGVKQRQASWISQAAEEAGSHTNRTLRGHIASSGK